MPLDERQKRPLQGNSTHDDDTDVVRYIGARKTFSQQQRLEEDRRAIEKELEELKDEKDKFNAALQEFKGNLQHQRESYEKKQRALADFLDTERQLFDAASLDIKEQMKEEERRHKAKQQALQERLEKEASLFRSAKVSVHEALAYERLDLQTGQQDALERLEAALGEERPRTRRRQE